MPLSEKKNFLAENISVVKEFLIFRPYTKEMNKYHLSTHDNDEFLTKMLQNQESLKSDTKHIKLDDSDIIANNSNKIKVKE